MHPSEKEILERYRKVGQQVTADNSPRSAATTQIQNSLQIFNQIVSDLANALHYVLHLNDTELYRQKKLFKMMIDKWGMDAVKMIHEAGLHVEMEPVKEIKVDLPQGHQGQP